MVISDDTGAPKKEVKFLGVVNYFSSVLTYNA